MFLLCYSKLLMFLQHFRTIQKMVNDNQDDWDQFIDSTLFSIRVKKQMTTKFTPFYLMYHREAKVPTQINNMPQSVMPVSTLKNIR